MKQNNLEENIETGQSREFPDGSVRVLDFTPGGVRRWKSTKENASSSRSKSFKNISFGNPVVSSSDEFPNKITKEEWSKYNKYLVKDNPFLNSRSYNELISIWFTKAYNLYERKNSGYISDRKFNEKIIFLDNCLLALLMYKASYLIEEIKEWSPSFSYNVWNKGAKTWNELIEYLEEIKEPKEVDYSSLYGDNEIS